MNHGLKFYGILLVMITTLVFTLNSFGVVHATTGINQNNPSQSNALSELNPDSSDKNQCDNCNNNDNDDKNSNNNDDDGSSASNRNDDKNSNNNDDDGSSSSSASNRNDDKNSNNNDDDKKDSSGGDVPMSLPFNSNVAQESTDEKDYSSVIPFP